MPPPKKADPPHRLEFTTNSIRNTTIAVDTDAFYYEIVTRFWHPNLTKINKLDNETRELKTVAEIERVPRKETKVRFGGEEGDWLKASEFMKYDPRRACVCTRHLHLWSLLIQRLLFPVGAPTLVLKVFNTGGKHTTDGSRSTTSILFVIILLMRTSCCIAGESRRRGESAAGVLSSTS